MRWVLFTGTWRLTNTQVELDVRKAAHEVLSQGNGIVTGGATGVDYFAMDEALKAYPDCSRLKVVIPANLTSYINDYRTNWCQAPITAVDIDALSGLLTKIKTTNPTNLIEMPYDIITQEHYNLRHNREVELCDEVYAFQVNESPGTQDTIDKAIKNGLEIALHRKYIVN